MPQQIRQGIVHIVEVSDQSCEGKEHHGHGDKNGTQGAEGGGQSRLHIGGALQLHCGLHTGAQQHEGGGGADHQRVQEDRQHLDQPLLHRMADIGRGGSVGGGAHAGLVGKEAPLHALHHGRAGEAGEDGLEIERLGEDPSEHLGNQPHVHDDDHQGHQHVQSAHDGHQSGGEGDDPLAAAHDAVPGQQRHDAADDPGRPLRGIKAVSGEGGLEVVGAEHVEAAGVGGDEAQGKQHRQGTAVEGRLNIIGRAAVTLAGLRVPALVNLRQRGFGKGRGAAQQGDEPHPEHGAVAAHADGHGHADNVARTYPGGGGHHQRLEGGHASLLLRPLHHHADGLPQQPQLREPVPNGEKQSGGHQQNHQQVGIHPVAQIRNDLSQHVCISLLFNVGEWSGNRFNQPE